jgi:hypothetical protein
VQNLSIAQIFMTCSQNQKIFKTDFCLNVEFEHRENDLMTYIWKKLRRSNERAHKISSYYVPLQAAIKII